MSRVLRHVCGCAVCRDALFAESALAPVLQELKDSLSINMHFIGQKQVGLLPVSGVPARCGCSLS